MISLTSAELHARYGINSQSVGQWMVMGTALEQNSTANQTQMLVVPQGKVFLATQIVGQATNKIDLTALAGEIDFSPTGRSYPGFVAGSPSDPEYSLGFLQFERWQTLFEVQNSPNWRNAHPSNLIRWKPKYPIVFPSGWTISCVGVAAVGQHFSVYGFLVDKTQAGVLGFPVSDSFTMVDQRYGLTSLVTMASAADLVTARAGQSIRILDINIRVQPDSNTQNVVTIRQGTEDINIFCIANNNPSELLEIQFSPDIFLKAGSPLQILSTVAGTASVACTFEYVPEAEMPGNSWFVCGLPDWPTPAAGTIGTSSLFTAKSTQLTLYNPKYDTTFTAAQDGQQLLVRGYLVSIQKDSTQVGNERLFCALSSGTAGGNISFTTGVVDAGTQTNFQVSPVVVASGHNQNINLFADDINVPCAKEASLYVDSLGFDQPLAGTTPSQDIDIAYWAVSAWGRVVPTLVQDQTNRGA